MSRNITAPDRKNLIRIASSLPKGSEERRAILAGLKKTSSSYRSKTIRSWRKQLLDWMRQAQRAQDALRDMIRLVGDGGGALEGVDLYDLESWSEDDQREKLAEYANNGRLKWDMRNDASAEIMLAVINTSIIDDIDNAIDALEQIQDSW